MLEEKDDRPRGICKLCGRRIIIRKVGQEYGRVCARKLAGQIEIDSQVLVSGKVLHKKPDANITTISVRGGYEPQTQ